METLNRKNPPVIQRITNINIPKLEKGFLGNGIPYSALSGGSQEFVYMHLTFNAGALYSNQKLVAPMQSPAEAQVSLEWSVSPPSPKAVTV